MVARYSGGHGIRGAGIGVLLYVNNKHIYNIDIYIYIICDLKQTKMV